MFNLFNSPMLNSLRRTFRPPTLVTGRDGGSAPFPLPLSGGIPEPDAVFGAEPSTSPVAPQPELPSFKAQPELDIPPVPPRAVDPARVPGGGAVGLVSNGVPNLERKRLPSTPVLNEIGNAVAEGGAEVLQKVTEGREAVSKLLADGKDAVLQRVGDGKDVVRQKEELIRQKRQEATARDRQIVGDLRKQAEQRKLEKAEERNRTETHKAIEGLGDPEFAADVEATLEDDLHRAHEMSGVEVRELRNRIQHARLLGLGGERAGSALSFLTSIRTEGLTPKNIEFFPTNKIVKALQKLEESVFPEVEGVAAIPVGLVSGPVGAVVSGAALIHDSMRGDKIEKYRGELIRRKDAGDKEAGRALERKDREG